MFKKLKNILNNTQEWFALLGVVGQLGIVLSMSLIIIFLSSLFIGSIETSYMIFVDPPALSAMKDESTGLVSSFVLMILGLIVTGFIISILSSSLENTFRKIRSGHLNYNGSDHTIIVNHNHKIENILQELNLLHKDLNDIHDVILLIDDEDDIQVLQRHIKILNKKLIHLKISIRHADVLSWQRYLDISILNAYSIIILSDDKIEGSFNKDNNTLRIVSLLFNSEDFVNYLKEKRSKYTPVKAVVELNNLDHSSDIIKHISSSLFLPVSPNTILSSILNLSMINIDYYNIWSELLSFKGHELYFISAKDKGLVGSKYRDILLRYKQGLLLGISRTEDLNFKLHLNEHNEIIKENDWLLFMAKDKNSISFNTDTLNNTPKQNIKQPKEIYTKNVLIIGDKQDISSNELLDMEQSNVEKVNPNNTELYSKEFYETSFDNFDSIILNIEDENIYRIALVLQKYFNNNIPSSMIFLVDDTEIAKHLISAGVTNTILSHTLISKYITQVSNQLALYNVFDILFSKDGPEINFILTNRLDTDLLNNLDQLKVELINSGMVYLGCEYNDGTIVFEAEDLSDCKKVIVFSNGEF